MILPYNFKHHPEIITLLLQALRIYHDGIKEHQNNLENKNKNKKEHQNILFKERLKDVVHEILESGRGIGTERAITVAQNAQDVL